MEQFEAIVHEYPAQVNLKAVTNAVECVKELFKKDLASFEKDWIIECLLTKPIELLTLISQKKHEDAWNKVIEKAFEMLEGMLATWSGHLEPYGESIVKICIQTFTPHIRKRGIQCLIALVKSTIQTDISNTLLLGILSDGDETLSSRVPVAELIGVICERRPEAMANIYKDIWRTYLYVLDAAKLTDSLIGGVMSGINGLLKEFGEDLPIVELYSLYDRIVSSYVHKKCKMSCINLLANHCKLFREKVTHDTTVRPLLWNVLSAEKYRNDTVVNALSHVYELCAEDANRTTLDETITDLYQKTSSQSSHVKNTAFIIISNIITKYKHIISEDIVSKFDRDVIEMSSRVLFEANQKLLTANMAESFEFDHSFVHCMGQACWLAPLGHNNSENLFRVLVLGYKLSSKRTDVIHCILDSDTYRAGAISFLISETCTLTADGTRTPNFQRYQPLWRDLFDSRSGTDALVLEKSRLVFEDFLNYVSLFMESILEKKINDSFEETKDRLSVLLDLTHCVMQLENVRSWMTPHVLYLTEVTLDCMDMYGVCEGLLLLLPSLVSDLEITEDVEDELHERCAAVFAGLDISRCTNEALLCVTCLALVQVPVLYIQDINNILEAYKLLFSRNDVEAKVLVTALDRFEKLLENGTVNTTEPIVYEIIKCIKSLNTNLKVSDQHGRLLRRNILLFTGKLATLLDDQSNLNVLVLRHIKDYLYLNLPNYIDGSPYKLHLQKVLHLAIMEEDAESLHSMLIIICANAEVVRKVNRIEEVLVCVIHKLCRCYSRGEVAGNLEDLEQAVLLFGCAGCVRAFLQCIITEVSPGVRKMLSDILTNVLQSDPLSDSTEDAVSLVMEQCCLMLRSAVSTTKRAGLDLTMTLLEALKNNNTLTEEYLPKLVVLVANTNEKDFQITFDVVTEYLKDKLQLFDESILENIIEELFKTISETKYNDLVYQILVEKTINIIKYIHSTRDNKHILELFTKYFKIKYEKKIDFAKTICVLSKISSILEFNIDIKRNISEFNNFVILNEAVKWSKSFYSKSYDKESYFLFESFLDVLVEFSEVFLEIKYQITLELISTLITTLPVLYLKRLYKKVESCMRSFGKSWQNNPPHTITNSIHMWLKSLQIYSITDQLTNCVILNQNARIINAIKLMLNIVHLNKNESIFGDEIYEKIKNWIQIIINLHNRQFEVNDKLKMAALSDCVEISLFFMTDNEILKLVIDCQAVVTNNLSFYQKYIAAFTNCLLHREVLSDERLAPYLPVLLYEILVYFGRKNCTKEDCDIVLDLIEKNWNIIEDNSSISCNLVTTALSQLSHKDSVTPALRPATWLLSQMTRRDVTLSQRIVFMETLTGFLGNAEDNELLSSAIKCHSAAMPTRLSELSGRSDPRAFTVILDALTVSGNRTLVDTVYWMVLAEETSGWWDEAIDQCMSSLSTKNDINIAMTIYDNYDSCQIFTVKPISQMLVPLLRYSSSKYNEEFFSRTLSQILACLSRKYKEKTSDLLLHKLIVKQTACFSLLQVMFEKVNASSLESTSSLLHCNLETAGKKPWFLAADVCSLCVTLRQPSCCDTEHTKLIYRQFQCSNYNCMISVLCKRRPALKFYERLFADAVWPLIFDCDRAYTLYIDSHGRSSKKRHIVPPSIDNIVGLSARTSTVRSYNPLFLRTLSDNPLKYDLLEHTDDEEILTQEIILHDNELNAHPCVSSISALLCHLSNLTDENAPYWIGKMAATVMADETKVNVKWFLCQIIVNGREELSKYLSLLVRPLADVVIKTAQNQDGRKYLNGLHIDILKTLQTWSQDEPLPNDTVAECVTLLIATCYFHKTRKSVREAVLGVVEQLVRVYGARLRVPLDTIVGTSDDTDKEIQLEILLKLTKNNMYIPGLLNHLTGNLQHFDTYPRKTIDLSKLYGLAVKNCQSDSEKSENLRKFHVFLDKKRSNFNDYVKILYYTQVECHECVTDKCFSHITDLAPKMTTTHKDKCYTILSNYMSHVRERDDYIIEMFASINIPEFILEKDAYIGIDLAKNCVNLFSESERKRIVFLVCEVCHNANWKIRKVSYELLLNAYKDIINQNSAEPSAKKNNITKTSNIISCVNGTDSYTKTVLSTLGRGIMDVEDKVFTQVYGGFLEILDKGDLAVRFCEIVSLAMVLPFGRNNSGITASMAGKCLATVVKLWLHALRDNDHFKRKLLRDEPIDISSSFNDYGPSKLLTMSKTYQGTFKPNSVVPSRSTYRGVTRNDKKILNVQLPIDVLLEKIICFAENNLTVGAEMFLEIFNIILNTSNIQQIKSILCNLVSSLVQKSPCVMMGVVVQMARSLMDECVQIQSFVSSVEQLKTKFIGSEAELLTKILYEETMLHTNDSIVLTSINEEDYNMLEENEEFSIKDLTDIFGKLSNWDDLTIQKRRRFINGNLPLFWTGDESFTEAIDNYTEKDSWLSKARDIYLCNTNKHYHWLKDGGIWPVKHFELSTITEAIDIRTRLNNEEFEIRNVFCDIDHKQCLAQWSVRLMLRSSMIKQLSSNSDSQTLPARSLELKWCAEANRRGLDSVALQCIQRNSTDLLANETLPWLLQQVYALKCRGSRLGRSDLLEKALHKSETYLTTYKHEADTQTVSSINKVILQLKLELNLLSHENIQQSLTEMSEQFNECQNVTEHVISDVKESQKIAFLYYCGCLDAIEESQYISMFGNVIKIITNIIDLRLKMKMDDYVACVLLRLDKVTNQSTLKQCAVMLFDALEDQAEYLDNVLLGEIRRMMTKMPQELTNKYVKLYSRVFQDVVHANMTRLKLLRSPDYALEQYVMALVSLLHKPDLSEWNRTFININRDLYDVQEGGASYRLLTKYKTHLDSIQTYDSSDKFKNNAERVLRNIMKNLKSKEVKASILLEDVCPALSGYTNTISDAHRRCLESLLGIPPGLTIVRFEKQIKLFTNSLKRPALLRAMLSNGRYKAFLIKCGEDLRSDAAAQFIQNYFNTVYANPAVTYSVTPLGSDAGVIEYLDDHVTVRDLIAKYYRHINEIASNRTKDEQLISQTQNANSNQFKDACKKIPSFALRNCIINECESVQDFIMKKTNVLNSLSTMTINHWILGLGDRHLQNMLYSYQTGAMCAVDWAAILDYTVHSFSHSPELMPARLTRNILAVIQDISLLESRLQNNLQKLRSEQKMLSAIVRVAFKFVAEYHSDAFQQKLRHIENKIDGSVLSIQVTRSVLRESNVDHKQAYIDILDDIFWDVVEKDRYSVEEQIYNMLRQSTDEKILAITRGGWEPWL